MTGPAAHLADDLEDLLTGWEAPDEDQGRLRAGYLSHLARHRDGVLKASAPSHFTASCLVLDQDGTHVLLTHHRRARAWFQFGGHLEPTDGSVRDAAEREAREESGLPSVTLAASPVQLDRHDLTGDFPWCREHLDIRWLAVLPEHAVPVVGAESLDVRWWPVDALPPGADASLLSLVQRSRAVLAASS